jgi:hypothetical protein
MNGHLVFITDPLGFGKLRANWLDAGMAVGAYEMRIVDSDRSFDKMVTDTLDDGLGVVIDPLLDKQGQLVKGYILADIETLRTR